MSPSSAVQLAHDEPTPALAVSSKVKAQYDDYRAHAINLHMLADQCPESLEEQTAFDRQQQESMIGQLTVLRMLRGHIPTSTQDAKLLISLWREEVLQGGREDTLSNTDHIALCIFDFFESYLGKG